MQLVAADGFGLPPLPAGVPAGRDNRRIEIEAKKQWKAKQGSRWLQVRVDGHPEDVYIHTSALTPVSFIADDVKAAIDALGPNPTRDQSKAAEDSVKKRHITTVDYSLSLSFTGTSS